MIIREEVELGKLKRNRLSLTDASHLLAAADPVMAGLLERSGPCRLPHPVDGHFAALAESIVYQQLAGAAARAIHTRFRALFSGEPSPESVLALPEEALRGAGLSPQKTASIRDLASKVAEGAVPLHGIARLSDEAVISRLVAVRGIGRWTAEMFLIFQLRRPDVWPVDDYGVRRGYSLAYGLPALPSPRELQALGERFRPHRTVAALYCWRAVELVQAPAARPR